MCASDTLLRRYFRAKDLVQKGGFDAEIDWQDRICPSAVDERTLLGEVAWVILSSGLAERCVRMAFPRVAEALGGLMSARWVSRRRRHCERRAFSAFRHRQKIDAIIGICDYIANHGPSGFLDIIRCDGAEGLTRFPYMGPATSRHLAKNLGFVVAKPDRHLMRLANTWGFESADAMCTELARLLGENIAVVDIVLWRYSVLRSRRT